MKTIYKFILLTSAYVVAMSLISNGNGTTEPTEIIKSVITASVYISSLVLDKTRN